MPTINYQCVLDQPMFQQWSTESTESSWVFVMVVSILFLILGLAVLSMLLSREGRWAQLGDMVIPWVAVVECGLIISIIFASSNVMRTQMDLAKHFCIQFPDACQNCDETKESLNHVDQ